MLESLSGLVDKADLAIAACVGVVAEEDLERLAVATKEVRARLAYPSDLLLTALAGGTGSGKSSLLNAIAGTEVALTGGVRPTTVEPLAVVSPERRSEIATYLTDIGVEQLASASVPNWLCLLDLPDTDSVELDHRLTVDSLLPRMDVVVWVLDPEKYRDASLHGGYLRRLSAHRERFVFVLNQIDRLASSEVQSVVDDLERALLEDGVETPVIVSTSASPVSGPPVGIDELMLALGDLGSHGAVVHARLIADLRDCASELATATGGTGVGFDTTAPVVLVAASELLGNGDESGAIEALKGLLESVASQVRGLTSSELRLLAAAVPVHVQTAMGSLGEPRRHRSRADGRSGPDDFGNRVMALLKQGVTDPARKILARRATANAHVTDLLISIDSVLLRGLS